mmetsp:Transcript_4517/g.6403  ORF Transcript_4517/g.6403 Transcript_4517/m.6403 type:complete len:223 (+) Transcript_4517:573-1241(+)
MPHKSGQRRILRIQRTSPTRISKTYHRPKSHRHTRWTPITTLQHACRRCPRTKGLPYRRTCRPRLSTRTCILQRPTRRRRPCRTQLRKDIRGSQTNRGGTIQTCLAGRRSEDPLRSHTHPPHARSCQGWRGILPSILPTYTFPHTTIPSANGARIGSQAGTIQKGIGRRGRSHQNQQGRTETNGTGQTRSTPSYHMHQTRQTLQCRSHTLTSSFAHDRLQSR